MFWPKRLNKIDRDKVLKVHFIKEKWEKLWAYSASAMWSTKGGELARTHRGRHAAPTHMGYTHKEQIRIDVSYF